MASKKTAAQASTAPAPVVLVCGEDEFNVKARAKSLYETWCEAAGGMDHEIIDGNAANAGEAIEALRRLREALRTLPFFGGSKVVWFRNVNFFAEDQTSLAKSVIESLSHLADELKHFNWDGVQLVVSAGKTDKRRAFYKTIEKLGAVESYTAISADDKDWIAKAELEVLRLVKAAGKSMGGQALGEFIARVGPNLRALNQEVEKLLLYALHEPELTVEHVERITSRQKTAQSFALAEAVGDRDLPRLLKTLDEELWEIHARVDKRKSEIGLLYGVITKIRLLLFMREMRDARLLRPVTHYGAFKSQLESLPAEMLTGDKRFNPLASHPFPLFNAHRQCERYTSKELVAAMESLLEANRKLVTTDQEEAVVLQQTLIQIVGIQAKSTRANPAR